MNASLEEQAFSSAWGLKAKQVFTPEVLVTLPNEDMVLMEKIMILGVANLPLAEREEVCSCLVFPNGNIDVKRTFFDL